MAEACVAQAESALGKGPAGAHDLAAAALSLARSRHPHAERYLREAIVRLPARDAAPLRTVLLRLLCSHVPPSAARVLAFHAEAKPFVACDAAYWATLCAFLAETPPSSVDVGDGDDILLLRTEACDIAARLSVWDASKRKAPSAALAAARAFRAGLSASASGVFRRRASLYDGIARFLQSLSAKDSAEAQNAARAARDALSDACGGSEPVADRRLRQLHFATLAEAGRVLVSLHSAAVLTGNGGSNGSSADALHSRVEAADWELVRLDPTDLSGFAVRAAWHIRRRKPLVVYHWVQRLFGDSQKLEELFGRRPDIDILTFIFVVVHTLLTKLKLSPYLSVEELNLDEDDDVVGLCACSSCSELHKRVWRSLLLHAGIAPALPHETTSFVAQLLSETLTSSSEEELYQYVAGNFKILGKSLEGTPEESLRCAEQSTVVTKMTPVRQQHRPRTSEHLLGSAVSSSSSALLLEEARMEEERQKFGKALDLYKRANTFEGWLRSARIYEQAFSNGLVHRSTDAAKLQELFGNAARCLALGRVSLPPPSPEQLAALQKEESQLVRLADDFARGNESLWPVRTSAAALPSTPLSSISPYRAPESAANRARRNAERSKQLREAYNRIEQEEQLRERRADKSTQTESQLTRHVPELSLPSVAVHPAGSLQRLQAFTEGRTHVSKPAETKPAAPAFSFAAPVTATPETKPAETKPAETKPAAPAAPVTATPETKPAAPTFSFAPAAATETKPTAPAFPLAAPAAATPETKPAETKPAETKPAAPAAPVTATPETKPAAPTFSFAPEAATETKPAAPTFSFAAPATATPAETKPAKTKPAAAAPTFSFAAPAATPETKPAETKPAAPAFSFAAPATATPETKPAAAAPTFSFAAPAAATETKPAETKPAAAAPTFSFAAPAAATETKPAETKPAAPAFSFAAPATATPETKPAETKPAAAAPTFSFAAPATATPETKPAEAKPAAPAFSFAPAAATPERHGTTPVIFGPRAAGSPFSTPSRTRGLELSFGTPSAAPSASLSSAGNSASPFGILDASALDSSSEPTTPTSKAPASSPSGPIPVIFGRKPQVQQTPTSPLVCQFGTGSSAAAGAAASPPPFGTNVGSKAEPSGTTTDDSESGSEKEDEDAPQSEAECEESDDGEEEEEEEEEEAHQQSVSFSFLAPSTGEDALGLTASNPFSFGDSTALPVNPFAPPDPASAPLPQALLTPAKRAPSATDAPSSEGAGAPNPFQACIVPQPILPDEQKQQQQQPSAEAASDFPFALPTL